MDDTVSSNPTALALTQVTRMRLAITTTRERSKSRLTRILTTNPASGLYSWLARHLSDEKAIVVLAALLSICAYAWYASHGLTLGYADALSRMMIARRVMASRTPGLAQLGTTWLPLHTMLMLPLIWNDTLFRTGFAGSFPSMVGYVLTSLYIFRASRFLFSSRGAAWISAAAFMLNPSVLYMQSTAMSEVPLLCTATVAIYYMLRWAKSYQAADLVKSSIAVAAGVGIRYDGWALAGVLAVIVAYLAWKRQGYQGVEAWSILYGLLAFSSCVAWVIYNAVIFHDPVLFFFYGSAKHDTSYMAGFPSYHKPWLSFEMYGYAVTAMVGWAVMLLAVIGLIAFAFRNRLRHGTLPAYALLVPLGFYWLIFFMGIDTMLLPELGLFIYWNARFGLVLIPAVAFFIGYLASIRRILLGATLVVILLSTMAMSINQTPLAMREVTFANSATPVPHMRIAAQWFLQHYHGGNVLISYVPDAPLMYFMMQRIPDHAFITDANGQLYTDTLLDPQRAVTWIILSFYEGKEVNSPVWQGLHEHQDWKRYFALRRVILSQGGSTLLTQFYERIGAGDATDPKCDSTLAPPSHGDTTKLALSQEYMPRTAYVISRALAGPPTHGIDRSPLPAACAERSPERALSGNSA